MIINYEPQYAEATVLTVNISLEVMSSRMIYRYVRQASDLIFKFYLSITSSLMRIVEIILLIKNNAGKLFPTILNDKITQIELLLNQISANSNC